MDDLLAAAGSNGFPITYDELVECVETNDKKRFSFDETGDLIRANQGHSVEVDLHLEREGAARGALSRHRRAVPGVDPGRGPEQGEAAPRPPVEGRGDGPEGRGQAGRAGGPHGRCRGDAPGRLTFFLSANGVWLTDAVPPGYLSGA